MKTIVLGISAALLCLALTGVAEAQGPRREKVPRWAVWGGRIARAIERDNARLKRDWDRAPRLRSNRLPNYYSYSAERRRNHRYYGSR
jgi:hypothetical protein